MDKIFIHALKTEAIIGIFDWERQVKQTVLVDLEFSANIRKAALSDSIDDTLNYKRVAKRVLAFIDELQFHLVETLAEHVAMLLLEEFGLEWVRIALSKPGAIRNSRDVGVIIERTRADLDSWRTQAAAKEASSLDAAPAVHGDDLAGDVGRILGQEQRGARNILRRSMALERGLVDDFLLQSHHPCRLPARARVPARCR